MRQRVAWRDVPLAALLALGALAAAQAPAAAPAASSPPASPPSSEEAVGVTAPLPTAVPGSAGGDALAGILGWGSLSSLSAASSGPCGIYQRQSSAAMCWGRQVGPAPTQLANFSVPTAVAGGGSWNGLASGSYVNSSTGQEDAFACGIRADGSLACWGTDASGLGLLGAGAAGLGGSVSPLPLAEPGPWSGISAGNGFSCAIKSDDQSAWCWGNNAVGQLGCGSITEPHESSPCRVASGERWLRVVAGATTACGISAANEGSLWCWGDLNMSDPFPSPIRVMNTGVAAVSIGGSDTCIILRNQSAACFPTGVWPPRMELVPGNHRWSQLSVGNGHKCGRTLNSEVLCWGDNANGQCGTGLEDDLLEQPTLIDLSAINQDADSFSQVEAGNGFSCVLSMQGAPYCFGDGSYGQLGDGFFDSSGVPVLVANPAPAPPAPPASPPPPPSPPPPVIIDESSGSTPAGAIVGGVVGGVAALAAAAAGLLWWRRRRRRAAVAALPHGTSKGALHSGSSNGKGGGGADASVEELHILQHKGVAGSRASGSEIPAGWSNEFVRSDQLLSWIAAHVTPSPGSASTLRSGGSNATAATVAPATPPAALAAGAPTFGPAPTQRRHSHSPSVGSEVQSPRIADIQPFELSFWDLKMERSVGRGSFVYLASWHETPVAVKVLMQLDGSQQHSDGGGGMGGGGDDSGPPRDEESAVTLSSPAMARFYKEAQLMAAMRHPNFISLLGFCTKPPALVTEYCARGSLTDVLREAAADPEKAARLTWQLRLHMALDAAKGMLALHSHNPVVLHRDLKGPNLLVDFSWRIKVTDFGLSKVVEEGLSMQSTQSPVNPRWLAPEILAGARASTASDVFSYGVILYELLTWTVPWGGADFWEIVSALTRGERLPIPDRASLPGHDTLCFAGLAGYIVLMQRCWAQEPAQRPGFEEVVQCLRRLLEEAPA